MPFNTSTQGKSFWKRPGGITLIVIGVIFLISSILFGATVYNFYQRIQAGEDLSHLSGDSGSFSNSKALTSQAPQADVALVDVVSADDPSIGTPGAPLTIVEFLDFECPFCQKMFPVIRELTTRHPESIYYVVRDLPLLDLHPNAMGAAVAAQCAHEQNRYWAYHDKLFANQHSLQRDDLISYARQVGINIATFTACLDSDSAKAEVEEDFQDGFLAGATGTPTFFINGHKLQGIIPQEVWDQLLQATNIE